MKKRPLPLGYFVLTLAIATLFISATLTGDDKPVTKKASSSDYLAKIRNNQATGQINPADYLKSVKQVQQQESNRSGNAFDFNWNLLGPNNLGGRTRALMFDNRDTSGMTVYAGGVMGGLFKSDNGGGKWNKIAIELGSLNVSCISQAGNGDIYVGTGEGFGIEGYTVLADWGYTSGFIGQGIFKSSDGTNFSLLPATKPSLNGNNELEWGFINELSAHPSNGAVYAATNTGLKFSSDGGNTWQNAKLPDGTQLTAVSKDVKMAESGLVVAEVNNLVYVSENGNHDNFILRSGDSTYNIPATGIGRIEFAIPGSSSDIIYALTVNTTGGLKNVYRSDDKGATWMIIGPGASDNFNVFNTGSEVNNGNGLFSASIEVFPDDPYHILIGGYDLWEGKKIQDDGFYHWTNRSTGSALWLSSVFLWNGHHAYRFIPGETGTFFAATNGGISKGIYGELLYEFQFLNRDYIASQFYTVSYSPEKKNVLGGAQDIGTIFINGAANPSDGQRGADVWTTQADVPDGKNGGYCAISLIYPDAFVYSRNPQPSTTPESFVRRNEFAGGPDWAAAMLDVKYASTAFLPPFILHENFEDYGSKDSVEFKATQNHPAGSVIWVESNNGNRPFKYITPVALAPGDSLMVKDIISARFFIGGDYRVLMSKEVIQFDQTPEWFVISDSSHVGVKAIPQSMALSSDGNHLFVGCNDGILYRISNIKYAYNYETADVNSPYCVISTKKIPVYLPGTSTEISQVITSIAVDPNNDERVLLTLGNYGNSHYVFMTDNALDENPVFRSVQGEPGNGGLPQAPVYSSLIEMDPDNNIVMVGTEFGIYATNNISAGNPTWVAEKNNVGSVPVFMLKQQTIRKTNDTIALVNIDTTYVIHYGVNNYGVIYGATYGRGLISLDAFQKPLGIGDPKPISNETGMKIFPNPASDKATVAFELEQASHVELNMYDLQGKLVRHLDLGMRPEGRHDVILNCGSLQNGTYILNLIKGNSSASSKLIIQ
jgi:hypothetical protein